MPDRPQCPDAGGGRPAIGPQINGVLLAFAVGGEGLKHRITCLAITLAGCIAAHGGPPFQTDDPEPLELRHYECYLFASSDGTRVETDTDAPALECNWGALPNTQLHIIIPATTVLPSNNPSLAPAGTGPRAFGLGDIEVGIKYRFVEETRRHPMISTYTMLELPAGDAARGLGVGKAWFKIPVWAQQSFGPWTTYGGGGVTIVSAPGYRTFPYAGWLVQRDLGKRLVLGTEVFYHRAEGLATPLTRAALMLDVGGYYKFRDPGLQLLFCYGHTVFGQTENYSYLGLYWTWGPEKRAGAPTSAFRSSPDAFRSW